MGKLTDKIAVITGATSGMALATAKLFVEEGAYVVLFVSAGTGEFAPVGEITEEQLD